MQSVTEGVEAACGRTSLRTVTSINLNIVLIIAAENFVTAHQLSRIAEKMIMEFLGVHRTLLDYLLGARTPCAVA
jgi:hypothetical protein